MTMKNDNATIESLLKRVGSLEKNGVPGLLDFMAVGALSMLANANYRLSSTPETSIAQDAYKIAKAMVEERKNYVS